MGPFYPRRIPYDSRTIYGIDIETNGIKPAFHEITEIALVPKDGEKDPWVRRFKVMYPDRSQEAALRVSGYNEMDWSDAVPFRESWPELRKMLNGVTLVGHNISMFDNPMIRGQALLIGAEDELDDVRYDIIDTMILARVFLVPEGLKSLSLKACRAFFNKDYTGAHAAYEDAKMSLELYEDICSRVRYHVKPIQESLF